jgi:hypothetical protein
MLLRIIDFKRLRAEIASYECTCFQDLRLFTFQMIFIPDQESDGREIRRKKRIFKTYIKEVILPNLITIEGFLRVTEVQEEKLEFKTRAIKYHFNFIIDSCIYANMINYKE